MFIAVIIGICTFTFELATTMYNLWELGSGNANFIYFQTIIFLGAVNACALEVIRQDVLFVQTQELDKKEHLELDEKSSELSIKDLKVD